MGALDGQTNQKALPGEANASTSVAGWHVRDSTRDRGSAHVPSSTICMRSIHPYPHEQFARSHRGYILSTVESMMDAGLNAINEPLLSYLLSIAKVIPANVLADRTSGDIVCFFRPT